MADNILNYMNNERLTQAKECGCAICIEILKESKIQSLKDEFLKKYPDTDFVNPDTKNWDAQKVQDVLKLIEIIFE